MKNLELNVDLEPKQQMASRSQKPTDHRKDQMKNRRAIAFRLYGIGRHKEKSQSGPFHLYGVERNQIN